jgi:hypothetical protein
LSTPRDVKGDDMAIDVVDSIRWEVKENDGPRTGPIGI